MIPIVEVRSFDASVNQFDTTDPVLGGMNGVSNNPIVSLTNRSRYLYDYKNGFTGITEFAASAVIDASHLRKLIYINATVNITLSLASLVNFTIGQRLFFKCKNAAGKCVSIVPAGAELLKDGSVTRNIWLYDGEEITLVARSLTEWEILDAKGNFDTAGNDGMVRRMPPNSFVANGSTGYLRADYARIWEEVSANAVDDAVWLADPVIYRQYFSAGDGITTFRIPDMRSMAWKALDLGRGISLGRYGALVGAYEPDEVGPHSHLVPIPKEDTSTTQDGTGRLTTGDQGIEPYDAVTLIAVSNGTLETTIKTAGFIPIIYF